MSGGRGANDRIRDTLTGLGGEDERRVPVVVGEVWIDVVRHGGEQLENRHKPASAGVAQPRLPHTTTIVYKRLDRCNPWPHVANRRISISQLLSRCRYLFTFSNLGLLSVQQPRPASLAHFRHSHIPELTCGVNSIDALMVSATQRIRELGALQRIRVYRRQCTI